MSHAEKPTGSVAQTTNHSGVRWRSWPCESCSGGTTPFGFLLGCLGSGSQVPETGRNETIDRLKKWEAARLLEWVESCPHTEWVEMQLPWLAQGSEHLVLFDEATSEVVKITLLGTYGDYYELVDDRISQFDNSPSEYLLRMRWWEELFSAAPDPIGITASSQIVSRQKFIYGELPTQEEVDQFLVDAGLTAARQSCWLWKQVDGGAEIEVWVGDARADNFVSAQGEIVPIDIRIWGVPNPVKSS